jgi:hypothetical protein
MKLNITASEKPLNAKYYAFDDQEAVDQPSSFTDDLSAFLLAALNLQPKR